MQGGMKGVIGAGVRAAGPSAIAVPDAELGRLVGVRTLIDSGLDAVDNGVTTVGRDAPEMTPWEVAGHTAYIGRRELTEFLKQSGPRQARSSAGTAIDRLRQAQVEFATVARTDTGDGLSASQLKRVDEGRRLLAAARGWVDDAESKAAYPLADDVFEVSHAARKHAAHAGEAAERADDAATRATQVAGGSSSGWRTNIPPRGQLQPELQPVYDNLLKTNKALDTLRLRTAGPRGAEYSRHLLDAHNELGAAVTKIRSKFAADQVLPGTERTVKEVIADTTRDIRTLSNAASLVNPTGHIGMRVTEYAAAKLAARRFSERSMVKVGDTNQQIPVAMALNRARTRVDEIASLLSSTL